MTEERNGGAEPAISARNLTQHFDGNQVLVDVSLDVQPGEFVSLVGPSGCGKTTFLNVVAGLIPVQSGSVSLLSAPPRAGRYDVAYMLARDALLPWRSAVGNVEFGMEVRGLAESAREMRAMEMLAAVGLDGFATLFPKQLSQGMRQRIALARTFALDSPILLMDEPFGALDAQTRLQLQDVLLNLWSQHRRTVLFVTHDLAEAVVLSDRVIVMRSRPAQVLADVSVPLPRPRSAQNLQGDAAFHAIYTRLWETLKSGFMQ